MAAALLPLPRQSAPAPQNLEVAGAGSVQSAEQVDEAEVRIEGLHAAEMPGGPGVRHGKLTVE